MKDAPLILTIGYDQRSADDFMALLRMHAIAFLIDIRTSPWEPERPEFSQDALADSLWEQGIRYVFMGDALGAQPDDPACYVDGRVSFARLGKQEAFLQAVARVQKAFEQGLRVALMDAPVRPESSHRSFLIGAILTERGAPVQHIDETGALKSQADVASSSPVAPAPAPIPAGPANIDSARELLKTVFGYDDFWPLQAEIIENALARRDTLVIMPTGGGKSLCYQLPALLFDGLTVVVSPLISLMQDQVEALRQAGVAAAFLNSMLDFDSYQRITRQVRAGEMKLLYVAPETLLQARTLALLDASRVQMLAIDEAHCISSWGHDFRPEYRQLLSVRQRYPQAVCMGLTATATPRVQRDIQEILGFEDANAFVASFDRPNLHLAVQRRTDGLKQTLAFLQAHREQSGIIYCSTRRQVDTLSEQLRLLGWHALPYHAGMEKADRERHQRQFVRDDVPIMVATIAFGMGIDKSNVRFVLHYNLPQNIESYYQEIGRAGRDGLRADCLLLYNQSDMRMIRHFIDEGADSERVGRLQRLQAMADYAQAGECRRVPLLAYFGEAYEAESCDMCDNCLRQETGQALADATIPAQMFLSCVKRTGEYFGKSHIIKVLRGSQSKPVLSRGHHNLSTYGIGAEYSRREWLHMAEQFIEQGLVVQDAEHGSLSLTAKGYQVFKGEKVFITPLPQAEITPAAGISGDMAYDSELFGQLRALRKEIADEVGVPAYVIFSDRALQEMATFYPQSNEHFLAMNGVGRAKLERYGQRFLDMLRDYCQARDLPERPKALSPAARSRSGAKRRFEEVGEFYLAGQTVKALQKLYGVKRDTIIAHLQRYRNAGHALDADRILDASRLTPEQQARVLAKFQALGMDKLSPIYNVLGQRISYEELRIMKLYLLCGGELPGSGAPD